ncbi:unnamed protein product [Rhodiola kirilowii]
MNTVVKTASNLLRRVVPLSSSLQQPMSHQFQQIRGIRVKVLNGNLEQALSLMQRAMISSGIERLIKNAPTRHYKKSEKRVLAKKALDKRLRSQEMARKLKSILVQKVRGV